MSDAGDFPSGPSVLLIGDNVDSVDNVLAPNGGAVSAWKNQGDNAIADFDSQGVDRNTGVLRKSDALNSVLFDGFRTGLLSLGSKTALKYLHELAVFDMLFVIRRRDVIASTSRSLFTGLATTSGKGLQVVLNATSGAVGNVVVLMGNGTSNILNFVSTIHTPKEDFVALLIRGEGTRVRLTTDFFSWRSSDLTGAKGVGNADVDYSLASSDTNAPKFAGDMVCVGLWPRNLTTAELIQLRATIAAELSDVPTPTTYVACVGDSLTLGLSELDVHPWPVQIEVADGIQNAGLVTNFGASGQGVAGMTTVYADQVEGNGYGLITFGGFINDIIAGTSATTIWANALALIARMVADGSSVILLITSPFGDNVNWTAGKQTQLLALRALMLAYNGPGIVGHVDLYTAMGSAADPTKLNTALGFGDGLHYNQDGDALVASLVGPVVAANVTPVPAPVVPDHVNLFGVTADNLYRRFFSQLSAPSTESNPTAIAVGEIIDEKAAELDGKLLEQAIAASALTDSTKAAYLWCRETLRLLCAIQVATEAMQAPPPLLPAWQAELTARWEDLKLRGYLALGTGAPVPASDPHGPTTHIQHLGLDTGDPADASSARPIFRKDDHL